MVKLKKNVKKNAKSSKSTKIVKKPSAKLVKSSKTKKIVSKKVVNAKKPSEKIITQREKKDIPKISIKTAAGKRILTAEGWKRMMIRNHKR